MSAVFVKYRCRLPVPLTYAPQSRHERAAAGHGGSRHGAVASLTATLAARGSSMNPRFVGFAALLGALFFLFSMNSRGPTHTEQLSSQLFGEIRSIQARWGSGGEAQVYLMCT